MNLDTQTRPQVSGLFSQLCNFQLCTRYYFLVNNIAFQKYVWTQIHKLNFKHCYGLPTFSKAPKFHLSSVRFKTSASAYLHSANHLYVSSTYPNSNSCTPLCWQLIVTSWKNLFIIFKELHLISVTYYLKELFTFFI